MSRSLSAAARAALYAQETAGLFPVLLEISHPDLAETIRVVDNSVDLVYLGNTYKAYPFRFDPPDETADNKAGAKLTIDNIDRSIVLAVRSISSRAKVKAVATFYNDQGVTVFDPLASWEFELANVTYDAFSVSGDLIYEDRLGIRIPALEFTPQDFPGVH